jgi:peptidoglycan/xylan/chitin deacetylase (PgdA/CDA1 family)
VRQLRLGDGQLAALVVSDDRPDVARIAIERSTSAIRYDIQLSDTGLSLVAGDTYVLSFLARADRPRTIGVGVARARAPWSNLGHYEEIELSDAWQNWDRAFTAIDSDEDGRVHFDVGGGDASVEVSGVYVRSLADGRVLTPGLRPPTAPAPADHISVPFGQVDFGSLRRVHPVGRRFGLDRGTPVDRHYIEQFLDHHRADIHGRVLEIGDRTYTRRFGGDRVAQSDVLHVSPGDPTATIVADLADAAHVPSNAFDCIILTQTLQLIYDVDAAVATLHRILKPGGVLLATCPGVTQTYDGDWGAVWCWSFTSVSARRLFTDAFGGERVTVASHGNVLAATAFLHGLAKEELADAELEFQDPGYDVTITIRAMKGAEVAAEPAISTRSDVAPAVVVPRTSTASVTVLAYHRIVEDDVDPWSLSVTPHRFAEQLAVIRELAIPLTLAEVLTRVQDGTLDRPGVVVTFDDGYADNLYNARPILERFGVPATVFVTSGAIDADAEFWWDALEQVILGPHPLPAGLDLRLAGERRSWSLDDEARAPVQRPWHASQRPPTGRQALYLDLWRTLRPLLHAEQQQVVARLQQWVDRPLIVRPTRRTLTTAELRALSAAKGIDIGAHSVTHPLLSGKPSDFQQPEIAGAKAALEATLGLPVPQFAYPYGMHDDISVRAVVSAGFSGACTTRHARCTSGDARWTLPRMTVTQGDDLRDWLGDRR